MKYPFNILFSETIPASIVSSKLGDPLIFDYTDTIFWELPVRDMVFMQKWTQDFLEKNEKKWGIAGFLEDRSLRLRWTPMVDEWRIFHLWIDIIAPENTEIFSPFAGEIIESTVEPWKASYWGYVVVRYDINWCIFYVLFGHLDPKSLPALWAVVQWGEVGKIWSPEVNGGWTTHTHMQVLTEEGFKEYKNKGYCRSSDIGTIENYCPNPCFLLRY